MIRRVLTQPGPAALQVAALPPGTPVTGPATVVYMDPAGVHMLMMAADPLVADNGQPVLQYGPGGWGTVAPAGRL